MKYQHPDTVYGCDWSPHNAYAPADWSVYTSNVIFIVWNNLWSYLLTLILFNFYPRGICYGNVAGWLAGCLSHADNVSKRLNLS